MAIIGNIAIGMSVGTGALSKGFGKARGAVKSFADSVMSIQGLAAGVLGGAATASVYKMAAGFAHLNEAVNKTDAVFKGQADGVKASAQAMADAYGMSVTEILDKQSMMGAMLSGVGFSDKAAANYSDVFTRLANDMTRRWDVEGGMAASMEQIMAALRGSGDALEKYGVTMTEETVKARAYRMGLARVGQELSEGAKKQARATIILEQMKSSIGAATDEAGSFGANVEALSGRWANLTATIGEMFAPAMASAFGGLGDLLKWLQDVFVANKEAIYSWTSGFAESMGFAADGTDALTKAVGYLGSAWDAMGLAFKYVQAEITSGIAWMAKQLAAFLTYWNDIATKLKAAQTHSIFEPAGTIVVKDTAFGKYIQFLNAYSSELEAVAKQQKEVFSKAVVAPDTGKTWQDSLNKTREGIKQMQLELARKPMELTVKTGAKGTADKLYKSAKPYGEAVLAGSAQAAKAIATARLGGSNTVENNTRLTFKEVGLLRKELEKTPTKLGAILDQYKVATVSM